MKLLMKARLTTLHNQRLQDIAILMYKVQNNPSSKYIVDLFNKKETKYELRNADFTLPCYNTTFFGKHSMRFLGPKIWTQLDKKEKEIKTLEQFKRTKGKKDL